MWAAIGVYGVYGSEDNTLYRRGPDRSLPLEAGCSRRGPSSTWVPRRFTLYTIPTDGLPEPIHVYGGDSINAPRSQWDPDGLDEQPWNLAQVRQQFATANAQWSAQLGQDLDERAY